MTVDLSPMISAALALCALTLTTVGTWAIGRLAAKLGIEANSAAVKGFDDALNKSVQAGAGFAQAEIAAKGYDHPDVKSAIVAFGAQYAVEKFAPALKAVGLDPANPAATSAYLTAELNRVFPLAMTPVAASPTTPPAPPSPGAASAQ